MVFPVPAHRLLTSKTTILVITEMEMMKLNIMKAKGKKSFTYLDSYDHSRCPGIGDFGGKGLANASRKAKSLKVGLLSFIWPLGTMKGLYFGFSLTGGGGPLLRNNRGDLGTMLGTCFMDFGGSMGPGALFPAAAFEGLSLRPFWSLRSV